MLLVRHLVRCFGFELTTFSNPAFEKLPRPLRSQLSPAALSAFSKFPADWPELELLPLAATTAATNDSDNYASFTVAVLTTTSRGNVTINSTDTNDNPLVSPNWLLTIEDQELAVQGFKRARQVAAATGATVGPEFFPGPSTQSNAQILRYIRETLAPIHHASTTCKWTSEPFLLHYRGHKISVQEINSGVLGAMGKANDPNAVVDTHGKVFGVRGLRVVDISAFPLLPPGHSQSNVCKQEISPWFRCMFSFSECWG